MFRIPAPSFSHRHGSSWTPRHMEMAFSSFFGSRSHSFGSLELLPVKPEPLETPLGWRTRSSGIIIDEGSSSSRLVKPKTEPALLPVKQEHLNMAADNIVGLKCARDDYVQEEMECWHRALEEIAIRRRAASSSLTTAMKRHPGHPTPSSTAT
ncbi:SEC12-like protein 2 [Hordeum vulgare]|nr:SEC12-like protein 2 [Hordeum vulgare]